VKAKTFLMGFFTAITLAVFIGIGTIFLQKPLLLSLPVYGEVTPFRLIDARGQPFDSARLNNKVWVTAFFFTTCSGICPIMTKNLKSLHDMYSASPDVEFVSISVNPEQDTPEALAAYAQKYAADTGRWHFLTGAREDITRIATRNFKVGSVDEPVFHSAYFILVDRGGRIRGYYEGTQGEEVKRLSKDLVRLYCPRLKILNL
jgi:protein SCO1/2